MLSFTGILQYISRSLTDTFSLVGPDSGVMIRISGKTLKEGMVNLKSCFITRST